jgi:hypothetical protein
VGSTPSSGTLVFRFLQKTAKIATYKAFLTVCLCLKHDNYCQAVTLFHAPSVVGDVESTAFLA